MNLSTPIEELPRIGPVYQKKLKKLGVKIVRDLLFHFPHRYEDFSDIVPIASAEAEKTICIQGKITSIKNIRIFKRRMVLTEALVNDDSGTIRITWFNQPYLINTLKQGDFVFLAGKFTSKNGRKYLSSPAYEKIPAQFIKAETKYDSVHIGRLIPVYPETEGLSSRWLRFIIKPILANLKNDLQDPLPAEIREKNDLLEIKNAILQIHFPDSLNKAELAKKRFVFEKLFDIALIILKEKVRLAKEKATIVPINLEIVKEFIQELPFKLTDDQKKACWQILKDMEKIKPMNRLLDGDVGSGKTAVALISALNAAKAGFQVAFMAPTEILSKQHYKTAKELLKKFKLKIGLITGKENYIDGKKARRKELLEKVKNNEIDILIGTHALVQGTVEFKNLGFVIIDEQHRFGIDQRAQLVKKQNFLPHLLSMTATPIPRTLALTIYGDLDLSLIKEMPKGRKKIITKIISPKERKNAYSFVKKQIKEGKQVFVICPRIESRKSEIESEAILRWAEAKAVEDEYEKLSKIIFPDFKIGKLHGKMKPEEKEMVLNGFKDKKTDIIISTSVIEVGIDFPNATTMIIEDSDKFGLAQLHQFRGRVGRGKHQSYCFLFSEFPGNPRLRAIVKSQDGFELAEKDLKLRGPGDLIGQRQWGIHCFVMDALIKNLPLVEKTRETAKEIIQRDPELKKYPLLRKKIEEFREKIHLE